MAELDGRRWKIAKLKSAILFGSAAMLSAAIVFCAARRCDRAIAPA